MSGASLAPCRLATYKKHFGQRSEFLSEFPQVFYFLFFSQALTVSALILN